MAFTNATVLVSKGTITGVATGRMTVAGGTRTIELDGKYLMPGMIDAPEVLAAEYHERPQPAEQFFVDNPDMADLMTSGLKGPANLRRMGTAMVICGVDWIKANATARAGVPETDPREPYFSEVELKALVETGADRNVLGAAHAHGDEGGRATVLAGVRSIEHGTYLSSETLRFMARRGTYLVPTVAVVRDVAEPGGDHSGCGTTPDRSTYRQNRLRLRRRSDRHGPQSAGGHWGASRSAPGSQQWESGAGQVRVVRRRLFSAFIPLPDRIRVTDHTIHV